MSGPLSTFLFFKEFGWKRCLFRTTSVLVLLAIAETVPNFGSILDLVGGSTVTMLTFVCPPYFYMKLCDQSFSEEGKKENWIER